MIPQYQHITLFIRHHAFRHARACLSQCLVFLYSDVLFSYVLRDLPPLPPFYSRSLRSLFCIFVASFLELFFLQRLSPKGIKMGASKQLKITKIGKTHHQNATTTKTCKNNASRKGQTFKIDNNYTVLTVFQRSRTFK